MTAIVRGKSDRSGPGSRSRPARETRCERCALYARCLPLGLEVEALSSFDAIIEHPHPLKRGQRLMHQSQTFESLFVVRSGSLKQVVEQPGQRDQVTHFYLPGEVVGFDGIAESRCYGSVVALESTFVCELPFHRLDDLAEQVPELRGELFRCMSRELCNDQRMMCLLSGRTADQRLASFMLGLSERFRSRGCSPYCFHLSMSRSDIGSYLGLALETVSRVLARFQEQRLVSVDGRELCIEDHVSLVALAEEGAGRHSGP